MVGKSRGKAHREPGDSQLGWCGSVVVRFLFCYISFISRLYAGYTFIMGLFRMEDATGASTGRLRSRNDIAAANLPASDRAVSATLRADWAALVSARSQAPSASAQIRSPEHRKEPLLISRISLSAGAGRMRGAGRCPFCQSWVLRSTRRARCTSERQQVLRSEKPSGR